MDNLQATLPLCPLDELSNPGSRGFRLSEGNQTMELFVVRRDGRVYGYLNTCPHTGAPLEWMPDRFLDITASLIQCALHGALFGIEDGRCLRGPCLGQRLLPIKVAVRDGDVVLTDPAAARAAWRSRW